MDGKTEEQSAARDVRVAVYSPPAVALSFHCEDI